MSFLNKLVGEFTHHGQHDGPPPPPEVSYPWRAIWDAASGRYVFENEQTRERTFEEPRHGHGSDAMALGGAALMYEGDKIHDNFEQDKDRVENDLGSAGRYADRKFDNAAADVADFPQDTARWAGRQEQRMEDMPGRVERRWDNGVEDVERKWDSGVAGVGRKWNDAVQDVADVPNDVAGFMGRRVGDVERFDGRMESAYDQGREEGRYEDRNN